VIGGVYLNGRGDGENPCMSGGDGGGVGGVGGDAVVKEW